MYHFSPLGSPTRPKFDASTPHPLYWNFQQGHCWFACRISLFPEIVKAEAGVARLRNLSSVSPNQILYKIIVLTVSAKFVQKENHV
jgi:hypothetical protein